MVSGLEILAVVGETELKTNAESELAESTSIRQETGSSGTRLTTDVEVVVVGGFWPM